MDARLGLRLRKAVASYGCCQLFWKVEGGPIVAGARVPIHSQTSWEAMRLVFGIFK